MTVTTLDIGLNPAGLKIRYDTAANIIHVVGAGTWSLEIIETYFAQLRSAISEARRKSAHVRLLADVRESSVQTAIVSEKISEMTQKLFEKDDLVAYVVSSNLLKMQFNRTVHNCKLQAFISISAAQAWLQAQS